MEQQLEQQMEEEEEKVEEVEVLYIHMQEKHYADQMDQLVLEKSGKCIRSMCNIRRNLTWRKTN